MQECSGGMSERINAVLVALVQILNCWSLERFCRLIEPIRSRSQGGLADLWHRRGGTAQLAYLELALLDLLHQFDHADQHLRRLEALQPQQRPQPLFDSPVVLLD